MRETNPLVAGIGALVVLILVFLAGAALAGFVAGGMVWLFETTWGWWS